MLTDSQVKIIKRVLKEQSHFTIRFETIEKSVEKEAKQKKLSISKKILEEIYSKLGSSIENMFYYTTFLRFEINTSSGMQENIYYCYSLGINESNAYLFYYQFQNDFFSNNRKYRYLNVKECTHKYNCEPENKIPKLDDSFNKNLDLLFTKLIFAKGSNNLLEIQDDNTTKILVFKNDLFKVMSQKNPNENTTVKLKDYKGETYTFNFFKLEEQYKNLWNSKRNNYIVVKDNENVDRIVNKMQYMKTRDNKMNTFHIFFCYDYFGRKACFDKDKKREEKVINISNIDEDLFHNINNVNSFATISRDGDSHIDKKGNFLLKDNKTGAGIINTESNDNSLPENLPSREITIESTNMNLIEENDQIDNKLPSKPNKPQKVLKSSQKPPTESKTQNIQFDSPMSDDDNFNKSRSNIEQTNEKLIQLIESRIMSISRGETLDPSETIRQYDPETKTEHDVNVEQIVLDYLKRFYIQEELPREDRYIIQGSQIILITPTRSQRNNDKNVFIKIFDKDKTNQHLSLDEVKDLLECKERNFETDTLYFYIANKYCSSRNLYFHSVSPSSTILKNNEKAPLITLATIGDRYGIPHLVRASTIKKNVPNLILKDVITEIEYFPDEEEIELFNPENTICQIFELQNNHGESIFVSFPFLKHLIYDLEHGNDIPKLNRVYDINCNTNYITDKEVERLLPLTNLYLCLKSDKSDMDKVEVRMLNGTTKIIPRSVIIEYIKKISNKQKLNKNEKFIDDNGNIYYINPYKIRPFTILNNKYDTLPYEIINEDSSNYYPITNLQTKIKEFFKKDQIIELIINHNSSKYNINELKTILSPNNYDMIMIAGINIKNEKIFVPKVRFLQQIYNLTNNEYVLPTITYHNQVFPLKLNLLTSFHIKPSPYVKDFSLRNIDNTYIKSDDRSDFIKTSELNYENDLYEFMEIPDIHGDKFIVTKPYLRKLLHEKKNDLLSNVFVYDSASQLRIISPFDVLYNSREEDKENEIDIKEELVFIEKNGNFFPKVIFNKCMVKYCNKEITNNAKIWLFDELREKYFTMPIWELIHEKYNLFVFIEDINNEKIIIHKSLLKKLINNKQLSLKEEIEVLDYFCLQKKININSVKDYLDTKQYDPKIYDININ